MKLMRTENYQNCVLLAKESMEKYFIDNNIPWNYEKRLKLYSTFEIYEMVDNEFLGYLALRENEGSIFIADLQILEPFRNKGYGAHAIRMAKELSKNRGYSSIKLKVFKNSPAINLYLRNGFVDVGEEMYVYVMSSNL